MAPVSLDPEFRYIPIFTAAAHLVAVPALTALVGHGLYRSYAGLSPSQSIRPRLANRTKLAPVFGSLAAVSLLLAAYSSTSYTLLSYQVWAEERGIDVPESFFGVLSNGHIGRWLTDTPVYHDALEIVAEKARRFWWGQQVEQGTASWSLLLAIEGRRRQIPHLWAYLSLAYLVNLSFAQNLFYLVVLLTPAPLHEGVGAKENPVSRVLKMAFPPKPANWCPFPIIFFGILTLKFGMIFLLPYAAGTFSFGSMAITSLGLNFALLAMPTVVPASWGTVHPHPHDAYSTYTKVFRAVSIASIALHGKATLVGLAYNAPDAHYHRHSIRIPFDTAERSALERTSTAVGRVLGSTADHPVVAAVGRDVLLSAISLGLWAAVRALDSRHIIASSWLFFLGPAADAVATGIANVNSAGSLADHVAKVAEDEADSITAKTSSPSPTDGGGSIKVEPEPPRTVRGRRGRPTRNGTTSKEATVKPETAAFTATPRRRGRPRKIKQDPEEVPGDKTYVPAPAKEEAGIVEGDVLPQDDLDWEVAALAWGVTALGGLGCGSAGVFGGECISRGQWG